MGEEHEHRGEEAERDVAADVRAPQTEHGGADEPEEANTNRGEQRLSQDAIISDLPSAFVAEWLPHVVDELKRARVSPTAIDLAMGRGRHAQLLARAGFRTFGVDVKFDAVRDAIARARADALVVRGWCADLTKTRLPPGFFDVVLVTRYLQRDLFPSIREMVKPGGLVLYETFTVHQRQLGRGPTSPQHLLQPGELRQLFEGFDVVSYEEVQAPEAVARIVARRRRSA
jgi:SAM-dependent methyltransferase